MKDNNSITESIDWYVSMGWKLFPIHHITKDEDGKHCSCHRGMACDNPGKHPSTKNGFKDATISIDKLDKWLSMDKSMNIGLATGKMSNVVVLDVDEKDDVSGAESLSELETIYGKLPPTLSQTTGSGGKHYFFMYPEGAKKVPSNVGKILPGLDIRADGGYVILPPSTHMKGQYRWDNPDANIADLPPWLLDLILHPISANTMDGIRKKAKEIPKGQRNNQLFYFACKIRGTEGLNESELFQRLKRINEEFCTEPLAESEVKTIAHSASQKPSNNEKEAKDLRSIDTEDLNGIEREFDNTERGNAIRYWVANEMDMRYCYPKRKWFIYDGTRWEENQGGEHERRVHLLVQSMKRSASSIDDEREIFKKQQMAWVRKSEEARTINNTIRLAQSLMEISLKKMDTNPYDFNCLNVTLNLETMEPRPHNPNDFITLLSPVEYNEDEECPKWMEHLGKIFDGDKKTIESFQRVCGYALTETNPEQVIFILWGAGKNGKSTTMNIIEYIMGDYGASARAESFMKKPSGANDSRNDLARLYRKRFVVTSEPPSGAKLNETLIKSATGTDKISARFLYEEFFEWVPQFKIFMNTNHRPTVSESDEGIWRRLVLIPFTHVFSEAERNPNIERELKKEAAGILNWMIEGYKKYLDEDFGGLRLSEKIVQATAEYRNFEDTFRSYIEDRCIVDPEAKVSKNDIFADFVSWCEANGEVPGNIKKFGLTMHGHFSSIGDCMITRPGGGHDRGWKGITLKEMPKTNIEKVMAKVGQTRISGGEKK